MKLVANKETNKETLEYANNIPLEDIIKSYEFGYEFICQDGKIAEININNANRR